MARPDLNLLVVLDVLLAEKSVVRAARKLRLSPSAMSRALGRVRAATGDPLLVQVGRSFVATPRALELRERVCGLVREAEATLTPSAAPKLAALARTFSLRVSDGFVEAYGLPILRRLRADAPNICIRYLQKADKDGAALREGTIDLETGVLDASVAEALRARALFPDRLIGVVRRGHPLCKGRIDVARYAASDHVAVSRPLLERGPIDAALEALGRTRTIAVTVGGFASALSLARGADVVATVPERHTAPLREGMHSFELPFATEPFTVSMIWHARFDADPIHRWLRGCVREVCAAGAVETGPSRAREPAARAESKSAR
jgi:DNA-binding transcriptional LysR family regulator